MKKKYLLLLNLVVVGCTTTINPGNVGPVNPTALPTVKPVTGQTATPIVRPSPTPLKTAVPSLQPSVTSSPAVVPENTGILQLNSGYIKIPGNSFLVVRPFELKMKLALDQLPAEKQTITFFDVFDSDASPLQSHFSLSLDHNKNFLLKAKNIKEEVNLTIPFPEISSGKDYEITFSRDNQKLDIFVDNLKIFSRDFPEDDFPDKSGRRAINIGANLNGENNFRGKIDFVNVKDIITYDFKNNLFDSGKFILDAVGAGDYRFITPAPTASPTIIPVSTPAPTPTPSVVRIVKDRTEKLALKLNVYNPDDKAQYDDCVERKKTPNTNPRNNNEVLLDCLKGFGQFTSDGVDFGTGQLLKAEPGDMRMITYVDQAGFQIVLTGNQAEPQVLILDTGPKIFEGIDPFYLSEKVDYTNANKIYSSSNASSNVINEHVYAIRTYRYGPKPLYAKVLIESIITNDYSHVKFSPPRIISQPRYVPSAETTRLNPGSGYSYFISTYDGTGETIPFQLNDLGPDAAANQSKISFSFELPYNSKGYTLYRKDSQKLYKIGPILAKPNTTITYEDAGNKGVEINQMSNQDTTTKSAFRPSDLSRPVEVNISYYFDGDGDLNFN